MSYKKYFWELNPRALKEIPGIFKNSQHSKYVSRIIKLLSRCDRPKEVFSFISKKGFIESWPKIERKWRKQGGNKDFYAWWKTIYEQLIEKEQIFKPEIEFKKIGKLIKKTRQEKDLTQFNLAKITGIKQPDISAIESGKKNITISTLIKIFRVLKIVNLEL